MPKHNFTLVDKTQLIPKVFYVTYQTDSSIEFIPGQFFSLEIEPKNHRPYSACYSSSVTPSHISQTKNLPSLATGNYVSFMISTKPGGAASQYFENVEIGSTIPAIGPAGKFQLVENNRKKIFVATGTGLAPFIPMVEKVLHDNPLQSVDVVFGCWKYSDNFADAFFTKITNNPEKYPNFRIITVCEDLEGKTPSPSLFEGRVTAVVPALEPNYQETDFYLCGHPAMVGSMEEVLLAQGAPSTNIILERYGTPKKG